LIETTIGISSIYADSAAMPIRYPLWHYGFGQGGVEVIGIVLIAITVLLVTERL
jgi:hypothetical protein